MQGIYITPIFSMEDVIDAVPPQVPIPIAKLDMQGYDFQAISSVKDRAKLHRLVNLETEVYTGSTQTYKDTTNHFCTQWLPHMTGMGMRCTRITTAHQGVKAIEDSDCGHYCQNDNKNAEADAFWAPV